MYLAGTPGSRPISLVDRVPIKQGASGGWGRAAGAEGWLLPFGAAVAAAPPAADAASAGHKTHPIKPRMRRPPTPSPAPPLAPPLPPADEGHEYCVRANGGSLTVTLVWTDYPGLSSGEPPCRWLLRSSWQASAGAAPVLPPCTAGNAARPTLLNPPHHLHPLIHPTPPPPLPPQPRRRWCTTWT